MSKNNNQPPTFAHLKNLKASFENEHKKLDQEINVLMEVIDQQSELRTNKIQEQAKLLDAIGNIDFLMQYVEEITK